MQYRPIVIVLMLAGVLACSEGESARPQAPAPDPSGLTPAQLENGIGPVTSLDLAAIDPALAEKGAQIFATKCAACHKFDQRYVGPSLGGLFERRTPAFVMNMMLNPGEMVQKHPEVKKLLAEYLTPMPDQNLSEEDARAVLEYLRQATENSDG